MMSGVLYDQCLAEPLSKFFSIMQEENLLVSKADKCSSRAQTITLFRKISAERVSESFYLKSY